MVAGMVVEPRWASVELSDALAAFLLLIRKITVALTGTALTASSGRLATRTSAIGAADLLPVRPSCHHWGLANLWRHTIPKPISRRPSQA